MKKLLFFLAFLPNLFSQGYVLQKTTNLSSTFEALTVDAPGTNTTARIIRFKSAYADCVNACILTLSRSGDAPSVAAAPQVPKNLNKGEGASQAFGYNASNSATNGTILEVYSLPANGTILVDLTGKTMELSSSADDNLTWSTGSMSGVVHLQLIWQEIDH